MRSVAEAAAPAYLYPYVLASLTTACRKGELLSSVCYDQAKQRREYTVGLRWEDINWSEEYIWVNGKTGRRRVPVVPRLEQALKDEWFEESVLTDDSFMAAGEDEPEEETETVYAGDTEYKTPDERAAEFSMSSSEAAVKIFLKHLRTETTDRTVWNSVKDILDRYGRIDVLVNNAGHSSQHRMLLTTTPDEVRGVMESNLNGSIFCTQAVVPAMKEQKEGTIINISSMAGINGSPLAGMIYSAAKAAVINFTSFLNAELKNTGIRASVVIPGEVDTPILDGRPKPPSSESRSTMVTAEDTAEAILLIANLPQRVCIPELVIRPTYMRDTSAEVGIA